MSSVSSATQMAGYLNTAQTLSALTGSSSDGPEATISGLVSGIDTESIISALMNQAAQPQQALETQLTTVKNTITDWNAINQDATQLQTAADAISQPSDWQSYTASSTSPGVTATVGSGAVGGSITFTVDQLAQAAALVSNGSVSSTNAQVTSAASLLLAQGGSALGLGDFSGSLSVGSHTIAVTTAATGATVSGTAAPASSTTITTGSNDTVDYTLNGQSESLTLAAGAGLTPSQLAAEITTGSNGQLTASVGSSGEISLASTAQGSSQTLTVTGGDALSALGIAANATGTGTDGVVSVDGVTTTLSDVSAGSTVTLNGPGSSTIQATVTGPLDAGSITATEISTGSGSLSDVVNAINTANLGMTASAVSVGNGSYRFEINSNSTGSASDIDLDPSALDQVGGTSVLTEGQDAELTVGDGPGAFAVSSATNSVSGLMPGVTMQVSQADPSTPVTVSLSPDASAMASAVSTLVQAANAMIGDLNTAMTLPSSTSSSSTSSSTATALEGLLLGDPTAQAVLSSVLGAVSSQAGSSSTGSAGLVGVTMANNGTLTFDQSAFEAAYAANPTAVANTFTQGASSSSPLMSMYEATDQTQAGVYAVDITQAATQASVSGATVSGGAVSTPETLSITGSGQTATYQTQAGETLSAVAAGINQATAGAGVGVEASVVDGALTLTSVSYGSSGNFSVSSSAAGSGTTGLVSSAGGSTAATGQDVAGTINGQAATGTGQLLLGALNSPAQGLLLQVTATAAQVSADGGNLGSITYTPGVAQALATAAAAASNPASGSITNALNGLDSQQTNLQTQINNWNPILQQQQQTLEQEYTAMESAISALDSTKSQLSQEFTSSSSSGSGSGG